MSQRNGWSDVSDPTWLKVFQLHVDNSASLQFTQTV